MAGCRLVASWQRLAEAQPTLQVVEVIADSNIGVHQVAARKGRWEVGGVGGSDAPALSELYSRLEYADAMVSAEPVMHPARKPHSCDCSSRCCRWPM